MADLIREQALQRLQTNLAAITGPNYSMADTTTAKVIRTKNADDARLLDPSLDRFYAICSAYDERHMEYSTGSGLRALADIYVLMGKKHQESTDQPYEISLETPTEEQVVNRLVQDFLTALWADPTLGGKVRNVMEARPGGEILINRAFDAAGWALAEAQLVLDYTYLGSAP